MSRKRTIDVALGHQYGKTDIERLGNAYFDR